MKRRFLISLIVVVLAGSSCSKGEPWPSGARTTADGVRWIRVKKGAGKLGSQSVWWSADWEEFPCDHCYHHVYNGRRESHPYDSFRSNFLEMREGELRQVWLPGRNGGYAVLQICLYQVYESGADGQPIYQGR